MIFSVQEGQVTIALVVNTTGSPMKIKHELELEDWLFYDRKVVTNPLGFPTAWVALTRTSTLDTDKGEGLSFSSAIKVVDYPKLKPVHIPAYRLRHSQRAVVDNMVNDMLEQGVIQESHSPWNPPLFLVHKRNGNLKTGRFNAVTLDEHYALPVLNDLLMSLGRGNRIFSNLDLLSGYWQMKLELHRGKLQRTVRQAVTTSE